MEEMESNSPEFAFYSMSLDGILLEVSHTMTEIFQKDIGDMVGTHWENIASWSKDTLTLGRQLLSPTKQNQPFKSQNQLQFERKGETVFLEVYLDPVFSEQSKPSHYKGLISNVSTQKMQKELEVKNLELLKQALTIGKTGYFKLLINRHTQEMTLKPSKEFSQITGLTGDEIHGEEFLQHVDTTHSSHALNLRDLVLQGESESWENDYDFYSPTHGLLHITSRGQVLTQDEDTITAVALIRDITEEYNQKQTLEQLSQRYQKAISMVHLGFAEANLRTGHIIWDPFTYQLHGYPLDTPIDYEMYKNQIVHPKDRERFLNEFNTLLQSENSFTLEYRIVRRDGVVRWKREAIEPFFDSQGTVEGVYVSMLDVTEKKLQELELERLSNDLEKTLDERKEDLFESQRIAKLTNWKAEVPTGDVYFSPSLHATLQLPSQVKIQGFSDFVSLFSPKNQKILTNIFYPREVPQELQGETLIEFHGPESTVNLRLNWKYEIQNGLVQTSKGTIQDCTEEQNAYTALNQNVALFQSIFNTSNNGILISDENLNILQVNPSACTLFQKAPDKLVNQKLPEILRQNPDKLKKIISDPTQKYLEKQQIFTEEGTGIWVEVTILILHLENVPSTFLTIIHNIDEEVKRELELAESEALFRTVADFASGWDYWIDEADRFKYVAPSVLGITGYETKHFQGQSVQRFLDIIHPEDKPFFLEHLHEEPSIKNSEREVDFRIITKSGGTRWIAHSCRPVIRDGVYHGHRASNRDVTEQKRLTLEIAESENRFSQIADSIEEIFWLIDFNGNIKVVNRAFSDLFKYPLAPLNFWTLPIWQSREEAQHFKSELKSKIETQETHFSIETRWKTQDGASRFCRNNVSLVKNKPSNTLSETSFAIVSQDITKYRVIAQKEKVQKEQLIQADKMASLGILVSGVAHEINNPNNLIMLNSAILGKIWKDTLPILNKEFEQHPGLSLNKIPFPLVQKKLPDLIDNINMGSERIKRIVHSLKEFVRVDSGELNQKVELNQVVNDAITIVHHIIKKSTFHFSKELADALPPVLGNRQQLEQVIINLLTNACQALPDADAAISLQTLQVEDAIEIQVSDEGCGISPENLQKIFDPFFTTKRDSGGTGLGLSVSHSIIEAHGGALHYQPNEPNGTTAIISIPSDRIYQD